MKRPVTPLLITPGFTGAVALLVVNDHVLKREYGNWLTGKLSDGAGVVIVAVLAKLVVRRDFLAVAVAGSGFVWLKVVPGAAVIAAPVLGGVTLRDLSDLLALFVLVPVLVWFRRRSRQCREAGAPDVPHVAWLQFLALGIAVVGATATSFPIPPQVEVLASDGLGVWAGIGAESHNGQNLGPIRWAWSDDRGRTWSPSSPPPASVTRSTSEACDRLGKCWRTIPLESVEVNNGSGWVPSFAFTDEQWRQQQLSNDDECCERSGSFDSVLVLDGSTPTVLVVMGTQGILRHDGQRWHRVAVLDLRPAPMPGPSWLSLVPFWTPVVLIGSSLVFFAAAGIRGSKQPRSRWVLGGCMVISIGAVMLFVLMGLIAFSVRPGRYYPWWAMVAVVLALGTFACSLRYGMVGARDRPGPPQVWPPPPPSSSPVPSGPPPPPPDRVHR